MSAATATTTDSAAELAADRAEKLLRHSFRPGRAVAVTPRLEEATRRLAARHLAGEFGAGMVELPVGPEDTPQADRYVPAIERCAREAPVRVTPGEKLLGSATLLEAAWHRVPGSTIWSISHTTLGLDRAVHDGYDAMRAELAARLAQADAADPRRAAWQGMRRCLDAACLWQNRCREALRAEIARAEAEGRQTEAAAFRRVAEAAAEVPERPARTFAEAVQSLWFAWTFQRLCGNWSALGRVDALLQPYYERDHAAGVITEAEARELIAHFWIKGAEWVGARGGYGTGRHGDAQFFQNVVLAGVDADGLEVAGDVTRFVLEAVEELSISDFPIAVRVNRQTPDWLWALVARVQRLGGGIVSIYSEEVILPALERCGFPAADARSFCNDGCWEVIISGKTAFGYSPFDALECLQRALGLTARTEGWGDDAVFTGVDVAELPDLPDYEAFHARWVAALAARVAEVQRGIDRSWGGDRPALLAAALMDGCRRSGLDYANFGPDYTLQAVHAGGLPDVANSLWAIRHWVFERKRLSLAEYARILAADWEGHEAFRLEAAAGQRWYGNDDPDVDGLLARVFDDFVAEVEKTPERAGIRRVAGISTFGREIEYRAHRLATAYGRKKGAILALNFCPTPGTDREGPTALLRSYCAVDYRRLPNGTALDLRLSPGLAAGGGGHGPDPLAALQKAFVRMGGWHLQPDVVDPALLREAQRHPERFANLTVRVSGWSARFATLNADWQEMVIQRMAHG